MDPNPSPSTILELAKLHGLTKKQTLRFFQNKRAREFPKEPSKSEVTAPPPAKVDEVEEFWKRMAVELQ